MTIDGDQTGPMRTGAPLVSDLLITAAERLEAMA